MVHLGRASKRSSFSRNLSLGSTVTALTLGIVVFLQTPASAICNPHRAPNAEYLFSGGIQYNSTVNLAGATIGFYTPYVDQAAGSSSSSWVMLNDSNCGGVGLAQGGFAQLPGDSHDSVFDEAAGCNDLGVGPFEFPGLPQSASHFNVYYIPGNTPRYDIYDGSTLLDSYTEDWIPNDIQVFDETHNFADQGYGGVNNKTLLTSLAYRDASGIHNDSLALTPNNVQHGNGAGVTTSPYILLYLPGGDQFETYDTECPT